MIYRGQCIARLGDWSSVLRYGMLYVLYMMTGGYLDMHLRSNSNETMHPMSFFSY